MRRVLAVLVVLAILAAVAKFFIVEIPVVSGNDMAPVLQDGDRLLAYRLERTPERGDLVLLERPGGGLLLRRVIGVPGDRVALRDESPRLDGQPATRKTVREVVLTEGGGKELAVRLVEEELPGGPRYLVLKDPRRRSVDTKEVKLEGTYWVLADHRNHATDSRTFGPVPAANIRAVITHRLTAGRGSVKDQPPRDGWKSLR